MTAQAYILSRLNDVSEPLLTEATSNTPPEEVILARVLSKKFRKFKADEAAISRAKYAIRSAVAANRPIKSRFVFGGNKLWRFEEAPEVDWAELFSLMYYAHWLKSIANVHKPGACIEFFSQDVSVASLNNVPRHQTDRYSESFEALLTWLQPYLPSNISFSYRRHLHEFQSPEAYDAELVEAKDLILRENGGALPRLNEKQRLAIELNVKLASGQTDDPLWREKVELEHQAIFRTKSLVRYFNDPEPISINAGRFSGLIVLGSTKYSTAKFWAGVGGLQKAGTSFHEVVLTPRQLQTASFAWESVGLKNLRGKNFLKIRVLP